ncbi:hypothetical protein Ae717Ps2_7152c [Pseudonocardia sp. Ae717_Ps2]|uniref:Bug family tripartite tricarboxylate transporter substrate binding protein n=1 Tax=Pseudonocardia sp. Ae717_Ps2 TaxID=1885573 RepID=UPI00095EF611|nr:tripartite tricarboxylate transporter substrate-binding protein [Pseudonocardia sp. Ae717_Ps2]OLM27923.1 hypothetical protein Ae717Ps2_7143c [Pseudonocardia sp. Ae717_Ps2]OLM27932.1 hypothetical protein Ae717Ps2_7152c [Pseudonocardia sp. Ae717_Ps2]
MSNVSFSKGKLTRRQLGAYFGAGAMALSAGALHEKQPLMEFMDGHVRGLRLIVPNSPGSGYHINAQAMAEALENADLAHDVEIFNVIGSSGVEGLYRLLGDTGNSRLLMSMGLGLIGGVIANNADSSLSEAAPIARLTTEPELILVSANSPYYNFSDLLKDWKDNPSAVAVGGGSSPGGPDHLTPMLTAEYINLKPKLVRYVAHDGRGPLLSALLDGKVSFAAAGAGEFAYQLRTGELRALAVMADSRVKGLDVPTGREFGVNVEVLNWRGVLGSPGVSLTERSGLEQLIWRLATSAEWKTYLASNNWQDGYLSPSQFHSFLNVERLRVRQVLGEIGIL